MKTKRKKQRYENHTNFVMAYENTRSILYINSKIPEHFAVFHAVKNVSLKCAVQWAYSVPVLTQIARYQYMVGERDQYLKVKKHNVILSKLDL